MMNNISYMKQWFLDHNRFLPEDQNREAILEILVLYGIIFENLDAVNYADRINVKDGIITYTAGPVEESSRICELLNVVNACYGYLEYEDLLQTDIYQIIREYDGAVTYDYLVDTCEVIMDNVLREFKGFDFDAIVYRVNGKVFFSSDELSESEIRQLNCYKEDSQKLFEVYRSDDGSIWIY